jgi:NitT/TauT family transport system substrate-binding protein
MRNKLFLLLTLVIIMLAGCVKAPDDITDETKTITINLTYIPNVQFAPFYVAIENGYFSEEGFEVKLNYGNEADLIALVGAGDQNLMIASGEQVLLSRAQGLPVVYVMEWYRDFPVGLVSIEEKGILKPEDVEGKRIGIPGLYGASYIGFEALLRSAGLQDSDVQIISIGYTQVEQVAADKVDAAVIYVANEPNVLKSLGYSVNVLHVADYISLVGNGLVTNEETLKNNPEFIRAVIRALIKAITDIESDPEEAYEICKLYVENLQNADEGVQKAVLASSIALWQTDSPGFSDIESWENMQELLLAMDLLKEELDLKEAFSVDYLP